MLIGAIGVGSVFDDLQSEDQESENGGASDGVENLPAVPLEEFLGETVIGTPQSDAYDILANYDHEPSGEIIEGFDVNVRVPGNVSTFSQSDDDLRGETLHGTEGNDLIYVGIADEAEGLAGRDMFVINGAANFYHESEDGPSIIRDYDPLLDKLVIYTPNFPEDPVRAEDMENPEYEISVAASEDGQSSSIFINGHLTAVVLGDAGLTADDVELALDPADRPYNNAMSGTDANDFLRGTQSGMAGDDLLVGSNDEDTIFGGDGNDIIYGGAPELYGPGSHGVSFELSDRAPDLLFGGDGDDALVFGRGDTVSGGDGVDAFVLTIRADEDIQGDPESVTIRDDGVAIVEDFVTGEDHLIVQHQKYWQTNWELSADSLSLERTQDGGTNVLVEGTVVAHIRDVEDVSLSDISFGVTTPHQFGGFFMDDQSYWYGIAHLWQPR